MGIMGALLVLGCVASMVTETCNELEPTKLAGLGTPQPKVLFGVIVWNLAPPNK